MTDARTIAVVNARAGGGRGTERWRRHARALEATLGVATPIEAGSRSDAAEATRAALRAGARYVIAAGGDGTVNGVVNGFFDPASCEPVSPEAVLVVLPLGTGNDYAHALGLHRADLNAVYRGASVRRVDAGVLQAIGPSGQRETRFFANTASLGMSARIARDVGGSEKRFGGWLAYWMGTLKALLGARATPVRLRLDGEERVVAANTVAVGNGRYVGGGMKIAPDAVLDDGLLDVVVIEAVGVTEFVRHSKRLYAGTHVDLPFVSVRRVRRLEAASVTPAMQPVPADADGEPAGVLPLACSVLPGALPVLAPWGDAEAVRASGEATAERPRGVE